MKRFAITLATIAALTLGGCAGTIPAPDPSIPVAPPTFMDNVIAGIKNKCSIFIDITDIPGIDDLIGTVPYGSSAEYVAKIACQAFILAGKAQARQGRFGASGVVTANVNGVTITGHYQLRRSTR